MSSFVFSVRKDVLGYCWSWKSFVRALNREKMQFEQGRNLAKDAKKQGSQSRDVHMQSAPLDITKML